MLDWTKEEWKRVAWSDESGCVCIAYLEISWYYDALKEKCKPAEAV